MIYTFYSYKGGVGRSMAMSNIAELFCREGLDVLVVDWDLEAPGLERYFPVPVEAVLRHPGLMDLLRDYKQRMTRLPEVPAEADEFHEPDLDPEHFLPDIEPYLFEVYKRGQGHGRLLMLSAGQRASREDFDNYVSSVRAFDWMDFYKNWEGSVFFNWLQGKMLEQADVVLIDSRTGVTEMGGVCTYQFADVVVMFCAPNQQNIDGIRQMAEDYQRPEVEEVRPDRPLGIIVVPSRVEDRAEGDHLNTFKRNFLRDFKKFTPGADPEAFWRLKVPQVPFYAFSETVAVREKGEARSEPMVEAFTNLARLMTALAPPDSPVRQLPKQKSKSFGVFPIYSERDRPTVERLTRRLSDEEHLDVFDAKRDLLPGQDFEEAISAVMEQARAYVVFVGPGGLSGRQRRELSAVESRVAEGEASLIPVVLPGADGRDSWPPLLTSRVHVDFSAGVEDERAFRLLAQGLRGSLGESPAPASAHEAAPYRGLAPFYEEHAPLFFGREAEVEQMVEALRTSTLLAVTGRSGCGKTSAVRAGLLPRLRAGAIAGSDAWRLAAMTPGARPFEALVSCLLPVAGAGEAEGNRLLALLAEGEATLAESAELKEFVARLKADTASRLLLVVDQFDELFAPEQNEAVRRAFLGLLNDLPVGGRAAVLLAMREDCRGELSAAAPALAEAAGRGELRLDTLKRPHARMAVIEPAAARGTKFEPGLCELVLSDTESPGELPLLSHTLAELWSRRRQDALTYGAYEQLGGARALAVRLAETAYGVFTQEDRRIARRIIIQMIQPAKGAGYVRRRVHLGELGEPAEHVRAVVRALADARVIVTGWDGDGGAAMAELAHDALIVNWPRVQGWLEDDREFLRWRQRLQSGLDEWTQTKHDRGALLYGASLRDAQHWLEKRPEDVGANEAAYIRESVEQEARNRRRTRRAAFAGVAFLGLLALLFGALMWREWRQRRAALSRQVRANAVAQLDADPELGLLLAAEAARLWGDQEALDTLGRALRESHVRQVMRGHTGAVEQASFSPDGKAVLTVSGAANGDGTARVWRVGQDNQADLLKVLRGDEKDLVDAAITPDGRRVLMRTGREGDDSLSLQFYDVFRDRFIPLPQRTDELFPVFTPDGRLLALTNSLEGEGAQILDAETGELRFKIPGKTIGVEFSRDGRLLVSFSFDGEGARVWDVASGRVVRVLDPSGTKVYWAALSPDSTRVVTVTDDGRARKWFMAGGQPIQFSPNVSHAVYSPDGKYLVTADNSYGSQSAQVWETQTLKRPYELKGVRLPGDGSAFSSDGKYLVTTDGSSTAKVWELATGKIVTLLRGHVGEVNSAAFGPDGRRIVTASSDTTARVWEVDADAGATALPESAGGLLDLVCKRVSRNLTADEWERYFGDESYHSTCSGLPARPEPLARPTPTPSMRLIAPHAVPANLSPVATPPAEVAPSPAAPSNRNRASAPSPTPSPAPSLQPIARRPVRAQAPQPRRPPPNYPKKLPGEWGVEP